VPELRERAELEALLRAVRTVAVLGISSTPGRAGNFVPAYLYQHGYQVYGVNPNLRGQVLFGRAVVGNLAELDIAVDLVNVFRRPAALPAHVPELVELAPRAVWLQPGARHAAAAQALSAAGIEVVQDRCIKVDHRHLLG